MNPLQALLTLINKATGFNPGQLQAQQGNSQGQTVQAINKATGFNPPQLQQPQPQVPQQQVVSAINQATGYPGSLLGRLGATAKTMQSPGLQVRPAMAPDLTGLLPGYGNPQEQVFGGGGTMGLQGQSPFMQGPANSPYYNRLQPSTSFDGSLQGTK